MRRALLVLLIGLLACVSSVGRVRSGERYAVGVPAYDELFHDVHVLQLEAASWNDDKRAARRALVDALKLDPGAADVTIIQSTHERMIAAAHEVGSTRLDVKEGGDVRVTCTHETRMGAPTKETFHAVEATVKSELERAKALRAVPAKIDRFTRVAHELLDKAKDDFAKKRGTQAEVTDELNGTLEVLGNLSTSSRNAAREAEDFVANLQRAVSAEPSDPLPREGSSVLTTSAKPRPAPKPYVAPAAKPTPKPTPKPATNEGGEVFNP